MLYYAEPFIDVSKMPKNLSARQRRLEHLFRKIWYRYWENVLEAVLKGKVARVQHIGDFRITKSLPFSMRRFRKRYRFNIPTDGFVYKFEFINYPQTNHVFRKKKTLRKHMQKLILGGQDYDERKQSISSYVNFFNRPKIQNPGADGSGHPGHDRVGVERHKPYWLLSLLQRSSEQEAED